MKLNELIEELVRIRNEQGAGDLEILVDVVADNRGICATITGAEYGDYYTDGYRVLNVQLQTENLSGRILWPERQ